jgi:UDP-2,3-diacylglucosamine pyrophosphatase LpxH
MLVPHFQELYVVSDLHLGGTRGAPIFNQGTQFKALTDGLSSRALGADATLGLVLNGDVIDSLAEVLPTYVASPLDTEEKLLPAILGYAPFAPVWQGLRKFVATPGRELVVVLGNHDLELAYPNAQAVLLNYLSEVGKGADEQAAIRGRVRFVTTGAGFRCTVGRGAASASVLCVHGNEFDAWNAVSPESMTRLVRAATLGKQSSLLRETPNAGTELVKNVMNAIKADWPFVDLLKPEIESVFTIMLALDPKRVSALGGVLKTLLQAETVGRQRVSRVLGGPDETATAEAGPGWQPGEQFAQYLGASSRLLEEVEQLADDPDADPGDMAADEGDVLGLGTVLRNLADFVGRRIVRTDEREALRAALLDWGGGQETWNLDGACDVFDQVTKLSPDADVVVAGHTHLRRQKPFPQGDGRFYLNTGTWARLMRLTPASLKREAFGPIYAALKAKSMAALDGLGAEVVQNQPTVGVIRYDDKDGIIKAALCEARVDSGSPTGEPFPLVQDATWTKVGRA